MENTIKTITATPCPHCSQEIFIEFEMPPVVMNEPFTKDQVSDAKADVLKKISDLNMPEEDVDGIITWITNPDTIFSPQEVPNIIASIKDNKK